VPNDPALPLLLDEVYPCAQVVEIDYQIPGCAPVRGHYFRHALKAADRTLSGL
jgi:coenzyme F420-reducing hydrogenase gamma subunit